MVGIKKKNIKLILLKPMKIDQILKKFPLRIALTDYCNLRCFFCSNEGMDAKYKNLRYADLESLKYLLRVTKRAGLTSLSLTGGEPSLYPNLCELLKYVKELKLDQTFFHTNGVSLSPSLIDNHLKFFSKVAVSIHTINFNTWHKLAGGNKSQFTQLMKNLEHLSLYSKAKKLIVEIKCVPMKGINDSTKDFKLFLDFCSANKFKFKFLNFEPITLDQCKYQMTLKENLDKVKSAGGVELPPDDKFRGQRAYLPLNWFRYKDTKGVVIEIGCGQPEICETCADSNEIFIDPDLDIKPCHASQFSLPLKSFIKNKEDKKILDAFVESRVFLSKKPGLGTSYWLNQT